ncbi:MAG: hypothetical protein ACF8PN_02080 [Phycisphaerales bacterium]
MSKVAVAAALIAVGVSAYASWPMVKAIFMGSLHELDDTTEVIDSWDRYNERLAMYKEAVDDKSAFFDPAPPTPEVAETPEPVRRDPEPVTPRSYGGPDLLGIVGNRAIFKGTASDPLEVKIGEERNGVELVKIEAPWYAHVRWRGGDFVVNLFEEGKFKSSGGGSGGFGDFFSQPSRTNAPRGRGGRDSGGPPAFNFGSAAEQKEESGDLGLPSGDLFVPVDNGEEKQ